MEFGDVVYREELSFEFQKLECAKEKCMANLGL